jgi:hypothetical protein
VIAFLPFFPIAALVWVAALPLIRLLAPPEGMAGLLTGWGVAGLSGASSFGLLALSNRKPISVLLKTISGGFAARMLLVIVGVIAAVRLGYGAGWFCLSFFLLYWIFFGLETLALLQGRRQLRQELREVSP